MVNEATCQAKENDMTIQKQGDTPPAETTAAQAGEQTANGAVQADAKTAKAPSVMEQVEQVMLGAPEARGQKSEVSDQQKAGEDVEGKINAAADEIEDLQGQLTQAETADEKAEIQEQLAAKRAELKALEQPKAEEPAETPGEDEKPEELDDDPKMKGKLSPELKAEISKRIGKEVGKRKGAEEAATAAQAEAAAAKAEAAALQAKLDEKEAPARAAASGLHPTLLIEKPEELAARKATLAGFVDWTEQALEEAREANERNEANELVWRGTDAEGKEVVWTAKAILARKQELTRELNHIIPETEKLIAERATFDAEAKQLFPEIFQPNSTEAQLRQALLKRVPGLRTLPNCNLMIGDMLAGERARQAATKRTATQRVRVAPPAPVGSGRSGGASTFVRKSGLNISLKDSETGKSSKGLTELMNALSEKPRKVA
jgi:hypothetical protein